MQTYGTLTYTHTCVALYSHSKRTAKLHLFVLLLLFDFISTHSIIVECMKCEFQHAALKLGKPFLLEM